VKSREFLHLTVFFLINSFWVNFYIGSFDVQLGDGNYLNDYERHNYARLFTLTITMGIIFIPIIGGIMDKYNFPIASLATSSFGFLWMCFLIVETKFSLIISFIMYAIYRTFLFTFVFAYLADTLGFKYFGVLAGLMFMMGGLLSLLQVPIVEVISGTCHRIHHEGETEGDCDQGHWRVLNTIVGLMILCTLYFSWQDWVRREQLKVFNDIQSRKANRNKSIQHDLIPILSSHGSNSGKTSGLNSNRSSAGFPKTKIPFYGSVMDNSTHSVNSNNA
jgi:MFS family permease